MSSTIFSLLTDKLKKVNRSRVVFTSFGGHYSDSPRYISEKIHELCPELELVWLVDEKYKSLVPSYAKAIDIKSDEARKYRASARAIVDNVYGECEYTQIQGGAIACLRRRAFSWLKKKRSRRIFTTWHGTPLKRMGRDQVGAQIYGFSCPCTTMILGNKFTLDIMDKLTFNSLKMELLGCPRNDLLFASDEQKQKIKERLGLPLDKKIILFAPTFRTNGNNILDKSIERSGLDQINQIDFEVLFDSLSKKFGGDFAFVGRFHYHVEKAIDFDALGKKHQGKFINGNLNDDMAEYLSVCDVLLTDASSSMFDFALTKRPCFIFFPDLEYYKNSERGFYRDIDSLPFPCSTTFEGLCESISSFDKDSYEAGIDNLLLDFGFVDDKDSSERVAKYIISWCKK